MHTPNGNREHQFICFVCFSLSLFLKGLKIKKASICRFLKAEKLYYLYLSQG